MSDGEAKGGDKHSWLDERTRRRAMRLAIWQGIIAQGGALAGGMFLTYFAMELGAQGKMMGVILSIGSFTNALRIVAPYFINRSDNRKAVCIVGFFMARVFTLGLPLLALGVLRVPGIDPLWVLVFLLFASTVAGSVGDVAWLSWFADIVPENIWGRYFGLRNIYALPCAMLVGILGGMARDWWAKGHTGDSLLIGYAGIFLVGFVFAVLSLIPLLFVPNVPLRERRERSPLLLELSLPFRDPNFRRYAYFNCWLMLGTGIPHASFQLYLKNALLLGLTLITIFQAINQVFAMLGNRWAGRLSDRFGNKPIIILGLIGAASGPLFWVFTHRGNFWMIIVSYVVWGIGWAGVGLCSQNLMLKLAPRGNNAAYIAANQGLGNLCLAICQILGGIWLERLTKQNYTLALPLLTLSAYKIFFLLSFLGRSSAALWVFSIKEPDARGVLGMVRALMRWRRMRRHALAR